MLAAENGTDKAESTEVTLTHSISLHGPWVEKAPSVLQAIVCKNALPSCCSLVSPRLSKIRIHTQLEGGENERDCSCTPRTNRCCYERNFKGYNRNMYVCRCKCGQLTYSYNMRHPVRVLNPKETCNQRCPVFPNRTPGTQPSISHGCKVAGSTF